MPPMDPMDPMAAGGGGEALPPDLAGALGLPPEAGAGDPAAGGGEPMSEEKIRNIIKEELGTSGSDSGGTGKTEKAKPDLAKVESKVDQMHQMLVTALNTLEIPLSANLIADPNMSDSVQPAPPTETGPPIDTVAEPKQAEEENVEGFLDVLDKFQAEMYKMQATTSKGE